MSADTPRHFLDIAPLEAATVRGLIDDARTVKESRAGKPKGTIDHNASLNGQILAMIFELQSTRTRVSFDVAMRQLGGETILLSGADMQLVVIFQDSWVQD